MSFVPSLVLGNFFLSKYLSLPLPQFLCLQLIVSQHLSVSRSDPPIPHRSLFFFPHTVIFPQVEHNSHLPRGVMNGCPLLKCLSITFECSLSLTSEQHAHRAQPHIRAHACTYTHTWGLYLSMDTMHHSEVLFSRGVVGFGLMLSVLVILCA